MSSSGRWALSPYDRRHTASDFYSEHPGRSQTAGRQRHASGITRYPADRSFEPSPGHRGTHHSHGQYSMPDGYGSNRHRDYHADSVSLSRSRSRSKSRDRDYDDHGRSIYSSHHSSRHSSHSGSLANSQAYRHNEDRRRDRSKSGGRDRERSYHRDHGHDYDYERSRSRDRNHTRSHEREADHRRRRVDESEHSNTSSRSRSDSGAEHSYSSHTGSEIYDSRARRRRRDSLQNERGKGDRAERSRTGGKSIKAYHIDSRYGPLTDPEDISKMVAFLLILGATFTLVAYILIILVGRGGWRSPNFWFELLFYLFILISVLLYAFNIQRVVDFLSNNFPFVTSRKGYASLLMFLALRSWPRTWPVDVTDQIVVHIAGNAFSLAGLVVAFSLYFVK